VTVISAGILTGAIMSGDLCDPQKTIPAGTILAQLTCSFIFMLLVFFYGGTTQTAVMRDKYVHTCHALGAGPFSSSFNPSLLFPL